MKTTLNFFLMAWAIDDNFEKETLSPLSIWVIVACVVLAFSASSRA